MVTADWCRVMAAYNSEMNRRLYRAAATLPEAARLAERGAWFGSIQGTLSHLVWGDHAWMARFAGWPRLAGGIPESPRLFPDWDALSAARVQADAGIEAWAAALREDWLRDPFTWKSGATGRQMTRPAWVCVTHFFNHQTHHRGQVHCLLTQAGVRPEDTDLPWVVEPGTIA